MQAPGTIRLIDTSLSSKELRGHCTALETKVSWNRPGGPDWMVRRARQALRDRKAIRGLPVAVVERSRTPSSTPVGAKHLTRPELRTSQVFRGHLWQQASAPIASSWIALSAAWSRTLSRRAALPSLALAWKSNSLGHLVPSSLSLRAGVRRGQTLL